MSTTPRGAGLSTRLSFFVAGFCMACWAPLIPVVKGRLGVDERTLGLLLLCAGVGSIVSMPVTGSVAARTGAKPIILLGGVGMLASLPLLGVVGSPWTLAAVLACFGASLGSLDVAMNVQAVEVERLAGRPLMSGFHALFSLGGFAGSGGMTGLLSAGVSPAYSTLGASAVGCVALGVAWPFLLRLRPASGAPMFVRPRGVVLLLALLAGAMFLTEGAMLDWGALLMTESSLLPEARSGVGYVVFSVAMTAGRLVGDVVVARLGARRVLVWGGLATVGGIVLLVLAPGVGVAMAGFLLIGLGASNLVPVLFSRAGRQGVMPTSLAIAAVSTAGYAGILCGPAAIGFVAHGLSLHAAFWMLAGLVALVPLLAGRVTDAAESGGDGEPVGVGVSDGAVRANSLIDPRL